MAFSESDRVAIRRYLGFAAIFLQADPRLESAITAVQSIADGGSRPDSSSETAIKGYLTDLASIEAKLKAAWDCLGLGQVNKIVVDPGRALLLLRSEGRRLVGYLADALSTRPVRDVFSSPSILEGTETFSRSYAAQAWRSG